MHRVMNQQTNAKTSESPEIDHIFYTTASRGIRSFAIAIVLINLLLPLGIMVQAAVTDDPYWKLFEGEQNAITWFSSVQLLLVGLAAYFNHQVAGLSQSLNPAETGKSYWIWLVFALGFVFLSLDERFEIHQNLREEVLMPLNILVDIPYVRPADVLLFVYMAIGLGFTVFLVRELRRRTLAFVLFIVALALIMASAVMDSLLLEITRSWPFPHFWTSAFEETGEIWSQLLFLLSFLTVLQSRLIELDHVSGKLRSDDP